VRVVPSTAATVSAGRVCTAQSLCATAKTAIPNHRHVAKTTSAAPEGCVCGVVFLIVRFRDRVMMSLRGGYHRELWHAVFPRRETTKVATRKNGLNIFRRILFLFITPYTAGPTPATSNSEAPTAAPTPVSRSFGTMSPTSVEPIIPEATGTPGFCTFVDTVVGIEKEEGQDRLSVQVTGGCFVFCCWPSTRARTIA